MTVIFIARNSSINKAESASTLSQCRNQSPKFHYSGLFCWTLSCWCYEVSMYKYWFTLCPCGSNVGCTMPMNAPPSPAPPPKACSSHFTKLVLPFFLGGRGCMAMIGSSTETTITHVISAFCCKVAENCTILGYYAASRGKFLLMFWDNISVPSSGLKNP